MKQHWKEDPRWFGAALLALLLVQFPAYAFYNPTTGRWLNRDPAGERAGPNLHGFVANDVVGAYDALGQVGRAPNVDKFYYHDQPVAVTATATVEGSSLCNNGHLDFVVTFSYEGENDARYAERAFFQFDGHGVEPLYSFDSDNEIVSISGCYTHFLSTVCPTGWQSGGTVFDASYRDEDRHPPAVVYMWGVAIYWRYKCNACCELEEPLTATYSFLYGPDTQPIPEPPRGGWASPQGWALGTAVRGR
jgi:RHS repeat-associated protein